MTATDELRRMLDERGVPWDGWGQPAYGHGTVYEGEFDIVWTADSGDVLSILCETTPEQAIEATLGRGTCHNAAPEYLDFMCSECGFVHYHSDANDTGDGNEWRFCPNCGRRVVAGDES